MGEIGVLGGRIDDQVDALAIGARDHQVVADTAALIRQEGVFLLAGANLGEVAGQQRFERAFIADIARLAHVGDVEQAGLLAAMLVLAHDAQRILDRHVIAGKRHHLAAELDMEGVKRGFVKRFGHVGSLQGCDPANPFKACKLIAPAVPRT